MPETRPVLVRFRHRPLRTVERRHHRRAVFDPLGSLHWQVHVYGSADRALADACSRRKLALHVFPWGEPAASAGLERDAVYLVRPDGYVALADTSGEAARLEAYLDAHGLVADGDPRP